MPVTVMCSRALRKPPGSRSPCWRPCRRSSSAATRARRARTSRAAVADPPVYARAATGGDVIVDALLGTGLKGGVREDLGRVIERINSAGRPVFALDVPSGLDSDTGIPLGQTVRADCTITFVGLKTGLFIGDGPEYAGTVYFDDLEIAAPASTDFKPGLERIVDSEIQRALPQAPASGSQG